MPRVAAALFRILILNLFVLSSPALAATAVAQQTASLTGHLYDSSGSALPGVAVTVSGIGLSAGPRTVFTDENGEYRVPDLAGGAYEIVAELAGFKTARRAITVSIGSVRVDLTLELAGIAESVIVRGARTSRSLMDTPASVAVLDEAALERRPLGSGTTDVLAQIPNVTATGTTNFAPAVRGADGTGPAQGADAFFAGTRPRLNVQIDGRPASYNEVVFGDVGLWDVEQVEMFRGAQSTVQGRNALAGTLVVKTKDPTYRPEATLRVGAGNLGTRQVAGVVSGPIIDGRLAGRFAFDRSSTDSFVDGFESFQGVEQPGAFDALTLRGKLLVEPDAARRFSTLATINHTDVTGPQTEGVLRPFDAHVASYPPMPVFEPETTGLVAESRWALNGRVGYEQTLAFTNLHIERKAVPGDGNATIDGHELVFEPRVRFATRDRRVRGFAGLYLFRGRQDEEIDLFGGGTFDDETETLAAFGEVTIALLKRFEVTLAGRVEREHRRRTGAAGPFSIDLDETYDVFSPKVGIEWHASDTVALGAFVLRGYNGGGAGFTYDAPFVSYTFDPEHVWSSESYVRADLGGGALSLTGNVFFSRYSDMQLPFDLNPDPRIWSFVVRNADAAVTYGSELGARWRPTTSLELFGNVGLLHTEITEYAGSSVEGHRLAQAPSFTADLGASYRHPDGFDASFDTRVSDSYFSSVTNDPLGKTDPYAIVNVQAGQIVSGIMAIGTLGLLAIGLYLWWPPRRQLLRKLAGQPWRVTFRRARPLHDWVGVWTVVALGILVASGLLLVRPGWIEPVINLAAGPANEDAASDLRCRAPLTFDAAIARASLHAPAGRFKSLYPAGGSSRWEIVVAPEGSSARQDEVHVVADLRCGTVMVERTPETRSAHEAMTMWLADAHDGAAFGPVGPVLVSLVGLSPVVMIWSGFLMWIRRRRRVSTPETSPAHERSVA